MPNPLTNPDWQEARERLEAMATDLEEDAAVWLEPGDGRDEIVARIHADKAKAVRLLLSRDRTAEARLVEAEKALRDIVEAETERWHGEPGIGRAQAMARAYFSHHPSPKEAK